MGEHQDRAWDGAVEPKDFGSDHDPEEFRKAEALLISEGQMLIGIFGIGLACVLAMAYSGGKWLLKRVRRPLAGSALDLDDMPG